jgi:hypothetical protein
MSNAATGRKPELLDYQQKSLEHAQNLILVRSAIEGWIKQEGDYPKEEQEDLVYLCVCHLTDAARHLKESPYLEEHQK